MNLFVYGTLMNGHPNHRLLDNTPLMRATSVRGFKMVNVDGHFPAAIRNLGSEIFGEMYQCNPQLLDNLDILESVGTLYDRHVVRTSCNDWAWMYVGIEEVFGKFPVVPNINGLHKWR